MKSFRSAAQRSAATTAAMPYTIPTRYVAPSPVDDVGHGPRVDEGVAALAGHSRRPLVLADTHHSIAGRKDRILQRGIP